MKKHVIAGLGEIGGPILKLLSPHVTVTGFDIDSSLMNKQAFQKLKDTPTLFLHICIPFTKKFIPNVISLSKQFNPEIIVIHGTISPQTTKTLQQKLSIPIIYSATRGVHKRMLEDIKLMAKFFAIEKNAPRAKWAIMQYKSLLKRCKIKSKQMSTPVTLELAKIICDTSYYGWLISYAQISNAIAIKHNVDYDEMWSYADEIHKILGNRPKMYPGYIGGHCVIPNLELIQDKTLNIIREFNDFYIKEIPNAKAINKKYEKSK